MTILAQALFALVRRNLMSFTFFSARHTATIYMVMKFLMANTKPMTLI
jgi:hypothetical protein